MLIGFAPDQDKGTSIHAVHEEMLELIGPYQAGLGFLKLLTEPTDQIFDILITNNMDTFRKFKLEKQEDSLLAVFNGPSECGSADICFTASEEHKKHLIVKYDWTKEKVFVVGRPSMDLLWATENEKMALQRIFLRSNGVNPDWGSILINTVCSKLIGKSLDYLCNFSEEIGMNLIIRAGKNHENKDLDHVCFSDTNKDPDNLPPLIAADILITDYADSVLDYLALDRPIIFIVSEDNKTTPWWYNENLPGPIARTVKQLCSLIKTRNEWFNQYINQRKAWKKKFVAGQGTASQKVVNMLMKEYNK